VCKTRFFDFYFSRKLFIIAIGANFKLFMIRSSASGKASSKSTQNHFWEAENQSIKIERHIEWTSKCMGILINSKELIKCQKEEFYDEQVNCGLNGN